MDAALKIREPGALTSVQDLGRAGYQRYGIPTSGALDTLSMRLANRLVGNTPCTAVLECLYLGPTFVVEAESVRLAFAGGEASIRVSRGACDRDARRIRMYESVTLRAGDVVHVGSIRDAASLYIGVEGGFAIEPTLGSCSTFVRGGIGGVEGRALKAGDALTLSQESARGWSERRLRTQGPKTQTCFRVLPGPQADHFDAHTLARLCETAFVVGAGSDRTGMRLSGERLNHRGDFNIVSDAVAHGAIQVAGDGSPIVLLADRQTTGGYPKIANVISADLPALGRVAIGQSISFRMVDAAEADAARRELQAAIREFDRQIVDVPGAGDLSLRLMQDNLVSGVVDAYV